MSKILSIYSNQDQVHQKMDTEEAKEEVMNPVKEKLEVNQYRKPWKKIDGKDVVGVTIPGSD